MVVNEQDRGLAGLFQPATEAYLRAREETEVTRIVSEIEEILKAGPVERLPGSEKGSIPTYISGDASDWYPVQLESPEGMTVETEVSFVRIIHNLEGTIISYNIEGRVQDQEGHSGSARLANISSGGNLYVGEDSVRFGDPRFTRAQELVHDQCGRIVGRGNEAMGVSGDSFRQGVAELGQGLGRTFKLPSQPAAGT